MTTPATLTLAIQIRTALLQVRILSPGSIGMPSEQGSPRQRSPFGHLELPEGLRTVANSLAEQQLHPPPRHRGDQGPRCPGHRDLVASVLLVGSRQRDPATVELPAAAAMQAASRTATVLPVPPGDSQQLLCSRAPSGRWLVSSLPPSREARKP